MKDVFTFFGGEPWGIQEMVQGIWGQTQAEGENLAYPICFQFWFIRDLMVVVLFSPVIYGLIKNTNLGFITLLGVAWLMDWYLPQIGAYGFSTVAWFFFMLGAWFGIRKVNVMEIVQKINGYYLLCTYVLLAVLFILLNQTDFSLFIQRLSILIGLVGCFKLTGWLINSKDVENISFLTSASFFIFAVHVPYLTRFVNGLITKFIQIVNPIPTDCVLAVIYCIRIMLIVVIALMMYYILKRFFSRIVAVVTGGR